MEIHLRQVVGSGYGISFADAVPVRRLMLNCLSRGENVVLRFDTMRSVTKDFIAGILVGLDEKFPVDVLTNNLKLRGYPLREVPILETAIQLWLRTPRSSPAALRHPDAIIAASRMIY
jgi:hypothetical protein